MSRVCLNIGVLVRQGEIHGLELGATEGLTEREAEIIALIARGESNLEIAALTCSNINSIKAHIRHSYRKMGVASRTQAVLWAIQHGLKLD